MSIRQVSTDVTSNAALQLQDDGVDIERMMQDALDELEGFEDTQAQPSPTPNSSFVAPKQWGASNTQTDKFEDELMEMLLGGNVDGALSYFQNLLENASDPSMREMLVWNVQLLQAFKEGNQDKMEDLDLQMPEGIKAGIEKLEKMELHGEQDNPETLIPMLELALRALVARFKASESRVEKEIRETVQTQIQGIGSEPNFNQEEKNQLAALLAFIGLNVDQYIHLEQLKLISILQLGEVYILSLYQDLIPAIAKNTIQNRVELFHVLCFLQNTEDQRRSEILPLYRKFVIEKLDKS